MPTFNKDRSKFTMKGMDFGTTSKTTGKTRRLTGKTKQLLSQKFMQVLLIKNQCMEEQGMKEEKIKLIIWLLN